MFKKSFAALAIAGALVLGGSTAATAYTPSGGAVSDPVIAPGESTTITFTGLGGYDQVVFVITGPSGASLTSIAYAASGDTVYSVTKDVDNGSASATFTGGGAGTYEVVLTDTDGNFITSTSITVAADGGSGSGELPATGGDVPMGAIWLGIGAVGLGGIAVTAAAARRRAAQNS
ncbi:LPXTG cell wall anchor domain-containing protein [Microbacterium xanthum]|uniref:LPXTG cell wall anchor domain-containing protein n=1 Tax=Microbacterium xanthum TaxID=3079794 RepID=UPI002AD452B0|nr:MULTISPECIES: LPXTG cell wall anchor domain-containing protein [unclassified Microbacterium]MDZ8170837.1 LPXTG cell wall anchor domain-containing protein [Microbacterium sp. KSW-48]MDZ8201346.1 LPXTG cell wall anchor domain-containing protein [Microbacterium sp. SSW1-59]